MGHSFDGESVTNLQKVLEMCTRIFMCLSTKLACLHQIDEGWLELESIISSSNLLSPTLTIGLVRMLAVVRAENSRRVLSAMASNTSVKFCLIYWSSDSKAETFLSLALVLLINASGSSM